MSSLPRILKGADARGEAVVVTGQKTTRFTPTFSSPAASETQADVSSAEDGGLENAMSTAERIISEAQERAASVVREAAIRGYEDGKAQGLRAAEDECREHLNRIAELARLARIDRELLVRSAERELATLAVAIAAKVIRREVATDPTVVLSMVESALEKVPSGEAVRVVVHPDDVDLLREKWSELRGTVEFGADWEVVGDTRIERGGCVIETRVGSVDSRIETQLAEIAQAFEVGS